MILRCQSHQPKVNVKPTLKQRRIFKSNRRTLYRRCFGVGMLTLNQRSQNNVRITLISRCRCCQPIFNQSSTSKRRRIPTGMCLHAGVLRLPLHGGRGIVQAYEMSHLMQQYVTYDIFWLAIQTRENNGEDIFWFHHV